MASDFTIPVVDLANPAGQESVLSDLHSAYSDVGFAYLEGHGISTELTTAVFEASRRFHKLSTHAKLEIELNDLHRGYIAIGTSTDRNSELANVTKPNQSASFIMMREAGPEDSDVLNGSYLAGPNQWPALSGFRMVVEDYNNAMVALARRVVALFATIVSDENNRLTSAFDIPTTWLRLLHYPPGQELADDVYGSAPHIDFGAITILAQDEVGGLQVQTVDGDWIDVPHRRNALVMNTGEMIRRWSNGRLLATPHRVVNTSGRERYSCAFFFDPNVRTIIEPLPSCVEESADLIEPIEYGNWLRNELESGYDQHSVEH